MFLVELRRTLWNRHSLNVALVLYKWLSEFHLNYCESIHYHCPEIRHQPEHVIHQIWHAIVHKTIQFDILWQPKFLNQNLSKTRLCGRLFCLCICLYGCLICVRLFAWDEAVTRQFQYTVLVYFHYLWALHLISAPCVLDGLDNDLPL